MNRKDELKARFRKWQREHPNFVTPQVEELQVKNDKIIELSSGQGFLREGRLFGVTVAQPKGKDFETFPFTDVSKSFENKKKAKAYMKKLMGGKL